MELVYLWVEEYKNIKSQGFNFSSRYEFIYNEEISELIIDDKKESVQPLKKSRIKISALVGENGSGKSSLFEILACYNKPGYIDNKSFMIYENNSMFHIVNDKVKNLDNNQKSLKEFIKFKNYTKIKTPTVFSARGPANVEMCLFTNDLCDFTNKKEFIYLKDYSYFYNGTPLFEAEYHYADNNFLDFNLKFFDILKNDNKFFDFLGKNFIFTNFYFLINCNLIGYDIAKNRLLSELINFDSKENSNLFDNLECINSEHYIIKFILLVMLYKLKKYPSLQHQEILFEFNSGNFSLESFETIKNYCNLEGLENIFTKTNIDNILKNFNQIDSKEYWETKLHRIENSDMSEFFRNPLFALLEKEGYLKCNFAISSKEHDFLSLSTGEKEYLRLIVNVSRTIKYTNISKKDTLFLIDEPDIALHPNWQKKLIDNLYTLYKKQKSKNNIHILVSSHSPFILSDLAKEKIIFLKKGRQVYPDIDTFGSNIHTLLSHGFFMKSGLTGDYAQKKINKAIKYLNKTTLSKKQIDYCEYIIAILGEPILKRQLQKMLDSKRLKDIDKIKERINNMEIELENLKEYKEKLEKE